MTDLTLRYLVDGQVHPDPVLVLWTAETESGYVSLLAHPELNYVIAEHECRFADGVDFTDDMLAFYIALGRPEAGGLAVALISALITNGERLIDYFRREVAHD